MGLIANEIVSQVLDRSDIVEVIAAYIPLKRAGRDFKALCPFHSEKSPSFVVSPGKQIYHCFGCAAGGNVINFIMHQERMSFPEAVRFLADKAGITIAETNAPTGSLNALKQEIFKINDLAIEYFHNNLLAKKEIPVERAREYLKNRGIRIEDVKQFKLGFALDEWEGLLSFLKNKNIELKLIENSGLVVSRDNKEGFYDRFRDRIVFPIFDVKSQCVGFGARTMSNDKGAKYINSPDSPVYTKGQHLFGLQLTKHAITKKDFAIVVEGYMDMIIPFQHGVDNIVASLGTALTVEQIRLLRRYTNNIVMLFDSDAAGQAAIVRSLDLLIEQEINVRVARLSVDEDPDSFIRKFGLEAFSQCIDAAQTFFDFKLQWLQSQLDVQNIEQRADLCNQMLSTLYKIKNEVIRFGYIQQLARMLNVPEQILLKEGAKIGSSSFRATQPQSQTARPISTVMQSLNMLEQNFLSLLLHDLSLAAHARNKISLSDLGDVRVRAIVERLFEVVDVEENVSISSFLNRFDDPDIQRIISNITAQEYPLGQAPIKLLEDCILRIKKDSLKSRRQNLSRLIQEAEVAGDLNRLEQLKEEFNQVMEEFKQLMEEFNQLIRG